MVYSFQEAHKENMKAFEDQLPEMMIKIEKDWAEAKDLLMASESQPEKQAKVFEKLNDLHIIFHNLAGSSSILGYSKLASIATVMDNHVKQHEINNIQIYIKEFESWLEVIQLAVMIDKSKPSSLDVCTIETQANKEKRAKNLIYLVEDDPIQARELEIQVGYFGYIIKTFNQLKDLEEVLKHQLPTAIIMDVIFPEGDTAGPDFISKHLSNSLTETVHNVPVIFISASDTLISRLQAVRAGGVAYFTKPLNIGSLIDALDSYTVKGKVEPYRILIVEDSRVQAKFISSVLNNAGMITEVVENPLDLYPVLLALNPDLILLDMYMEPCNGIELAKVIRQIEAFVSVPIVFLSAETDKDTQLTAMSFGGDDFLSKPIKPDHLIRSITSRVERHRKLRSVMINDSLTGLLNHTTISSRLNQEINRARRQQTSLCFSMIDIDHFKKVNDTYGHPTGDRVLKSLANYLRQRLRSTDIIGRYGGEEFAIIFPDTMITAGEKVLKELNEGFAKVIHRPVTGIEAEFTVTFSGGIASFPTFVDYISLTDAADKALYAAKHQGRNCIVRADPS